MVIKKHYVGEIGTAIVVDTGRDISASTAQELRVKKPDGTLVVWDGFIYTISSQPNYIKYSLLLNDFNISGRYEVQAYVVLPGSPEWQGLGETARFLVYDTYE